MHITFPFDLYFICPLLDLLASRDAVDNRFQHTLDVLTGITVGQSNLQTQELLIDTLNFVQYGLFRIYLAMLKPVMAVMDFSPLHLRLFSL